MSVGAVDIATGDRLIQRTVVLRAPNSILAIDDDECRHARDMNGQTARRSIRPILLTALQYWNYFQAMCLAHP